MADRYTYIPMIGLSLMVAWLLPPAWTGRKVIRQALIITAIALSTTWGLLARAQVRHWKDGETLFRHALAVTTDNDLAHKNLGNILRQQGRYDEAIGHYEQALRINPNYTVARIGLAVALRETGKVQEAAAHYEQALRLDPGNVEARNNLANICFQSGRFDEAIGHYMQALRLSPDHAEVHKNLGAALLRIGDTAQAIRHYEQALTLALATGQQTLAMDVEHRLERVRHIQSPPGAP